jgi:hypothetical protein
MANKDDFMKKAFHVLEQDSVPTQHQKDMMLNNILMECKAENTSGIGKLKKMIIAYPWRFAFAASTAQAVVFTMIFGTKYTHLFLGFFGG